MNKYIDEIVVLKTGDLVLVEKIEIFDVNNTLISTAYSRRTVKVGQSLIEEDPRVQQIGSLVHSEAFLGIPVIPINNSDWDSFNLQMMSSPRFNEVYNLCSAQMPIVASALPVAIDQITTKGYSLFTLVWTQLCSVGGATAEDKQAWAELAENNNLPQEFIDILIA